MYYLLFSGKSLESLEVTLQEKVQVERIALEREIDMLERAIQHRKRDEELKVLKLVQSVFIDEEYETTIVTVLSKQQEELLEGLESDEEK